MKSAEKDLVVNDLLTLIGKGLHDIPSNLLQNAQSAVGFVVYNVGEQMRLDLLREDVIGDTLEAIIAN